MRFLFDMDGTLVDTHRALKLAYRKAGIKMPDEAFGKRWQEWCPEEVHREKERLYPNFLREYMRILPATSLLALTRGQVLTGASLAAVNAVHTVIGDFDVLGYNYTSSDKLEAMAVVCESGDPVMWVDDDKTFGLHALDQLGVNFLHVTEQDGVFHLHSPHMPEAFQRWTLSSWQQGATRG